MTLRAYEKLLSLRLSQRNIFIYGSVNLTREGEKMHMCVKTMKKVLRFIKKINRAKCNFYLVWWP